jgi:16S rRNA (uracil1498-N3)-methyltransferase
VPVVSARCISRPDEKSLKKKQLRWQKIAKEAAQQSRRGVIPAVENTLTFKQAVSQLETENAKNIIFYECGGESVKKLLDKPYEKINIFIGSEGGFEESEVQSIIEKGGHSATLGKRILRAETAPLAALSIIMFATGNFE